MLALDAKMSLDENALFRHNDLEELRDKTQEDPRETYANDAGLSYVGLDGTIGCIINGAGLAMATLDMIKLAGGEPANFLDIGGAASPERVAKSFRAVLRDENVGAIFVNIFAGINRCDWVAEGIIKAIGRGRDPGPADRPSRRHQCRAGHGDPPCRDAPDHHRRDAWRRRREVRRRMRAKPRKPRNQP